MGFTFELHFNSAAFQPRFQLRFSCVPAAFYLQLQKVFYSIVSHVHSYPIKPKFRLQRKLIDLLCKFCSRTENLKHLIKLFNMRGLFFILKEIYIIAILAILF